MTNNTQIIFIKGNFHFLLFKEMIHINICKESGNDWKEGKKYMGIKGDQIHSPG